MLTELQASHHRCGCITSNHARSEGKIEGIRVIIVIVRQNHHAPHDAVTIYEGKVLGRDQKNSGRLATGYHNMAAERQELHLEPETFRPTGPCSHGV